MEEKVEKLFQLYNKKLEIDPDAPTLWRKEHIKFLKQSISYLPATYAVSNSASSVVRGCINIDLESYSWMYELFFSAWILVALGCVTGFVIR